MTKGYIFSRPTLSLALILLVLLATTEACNLAAAALSPQRRLTATSITLESSPNPATTNDRVTLSGQLLGGQRPLDSQTVQIQYSTDASTWNTIASSLTGPDGRFSAVWQPTSAAQFLLNASYAGNKQNSPSSSSVIIENVSDSPITPPSTGVVRVGVNYLSLYHLYETSTDLLQRDFAMFRNDGINAIAIALFWYRLESSKGVYNLQFVNNVIRVCNVAQQYGLEVMIDFHTLIQDSDSWSNPKYVGSGMNLIIDRSIADSYVATVSWTLNQLKGVPNIWSYSVLNEPWYWPLTDSSKTNWIELMVRLSSAVKQITGKQVTVRFVGALFERDWAWDPRIISALDFISLNAYINAASTRAIDWQTVDEYSSGLKSIADKAATLGKSVQITEFGSDLSDDNAQAAEYRTYTDVFKATNNLIGWFSWGWDRSYDANNPTWDACGTFSVVVQSTGTPRPAYLILVQNK